MYNFKSQEEFYNWYYENLLDGPASFIVYDEHWSTKYWMEDSEGYHLVTANIYPVYDKQTFLFN